MMGDRVPYPVSFKLSKVLVKALDGIAKKDNRTRNATVTQVLSDFVLSRERRVRKQAPAKKKHATAKRARA
jgi:predicted transcriptional regulator